jgi:uncharacterized protein
MKKYHLHNRPDRELKSETDINAILINGKFAVISMCRENEPYIVTLSYGYDPEKKALYFHCAQQGLKLDFIEANSKVCATVIEDGGYIKGECEHEFRSVVFWGDMQEVKELEEKKHGMNILLQHLEGQDSVIKQKTLKAEGFYSKMKILRLDIAQICGKAGR